MEFLDSFKFNNCPPPQDFINEDAWEIRERLIVDTSGDTRPTSPPKVDTVTRYSLAEGNPRYLVEKEARLGSGGYAAVHRGWDRRLGKYVAVKALSAYWSDATESQELFELEAKSMSRVSHPGIPEVYDINLAKKPDGNTVPVIIMELITGENLFGRLIDSSRRLLSPKEVVEIVFQAASVLDFMDKLGVHHGDLKCKNILLSKPHLKIIDFGNSDWANPRGTKAYTPGYAPPEFFSRQMSIKSDEYSLAATTYDILFHTTPPENFDELKDEFLKGELHYKVDEKTYKSLLDLFLKGLAEKPEERFASCTEFAEAFYSIFKNV